MITNFEDLTQELSPKEHAMLPVFIASFSKYGKGNPIKEPEIISRMAASGYKLTGSRLRKIVNHIRVNGLLPLIATSKGYYVSYDREEILKQMRSSYERAKAIERSADGLKKFI